MGLRTSFLIASIALCLASVANAQTTERLEQLCNGPNPDIRRLACTAIIEYGLATGDKLADAYAARGTAFVIGRDLDKAIEDFDHALMLDPDRVVVVGYRAAAHLSRHDYDAAIADFSRVIALDPSDNDALYSRAGAYRAKGDNDSAIADYSRVIEIDPGFQPAIAYRGIAYRAKEEIDRAIEDFDRLIAINPDDAGALNLRGSAYRDKEDADHALFDFDRALTLDPDNATIIDNRGFAELMFGHFAQAETDFARALQLQPTNSYNALWLDLARRKDGRSQAPPTDSSPPDAGTWPGPVLSLYRSEMNAADVRAAAQAIGANAVGRVCEAAFYISELELVRGDIDAAKADLNQAVSVCPHMFLEYVGAVHELKGLR